MIAFRIGTESDAPDVSALISSFQADMVDASADDGAAQFLASVSVEAVRTHLASARNEFLLAHDDGMLVGVVAISGRAHLLYLFVAHTHQRRGLGRKLWELARAQAVASGHPGPFTVGASMNAVPVYERLGFEAVGSPALSHGVMCVFMISKGALKGQLMSIVLPSHNLYPGMNAAAGEILQTVGPAFTGTPDVHLPTAIAAAASLAGSVLLHGADPDAERRRKGRPDLSEPHGRQLNLLIFMESIVREIDPVIAATLERMVPAEGLIGSGWGSEVPPEIAPLFDADTMLGRLQGLVERVADQHGIPVMFRGHVAGLAIMKLIASGQGSGLLDHKVGKSLARNYMAAGCRTSPVPLFVKPPARS